MALLQFMVQSLMSEIRGPEEREAGAFRGGALGPIIAPCTMANGVRRLAAQPSSEN